MPKYNVRENIWVVSHPKAKLSFSFAHQRVNSVDALPETGCAAIVIVLEQDSDIEYFYKLRQKQAFYLTPVFYWGELDYEKATLFDGKINEHFIEMVEAINDRLALIPNAIKNSSNLESILIMLLFSRVQLKIQGHLNYQDIYVINFPLLNIYIQEKVFDAWAFLQDLQQRNLLIEKDLIDEIQACPFCHSGHLNFKNSCPNCHSIDIKSQQFIHCFSCGNIAPISEFLTKEQLICVRCNTKLRHVGIDYDKPLEDKLCHTCAHYFIESEILITCLYCKKTLKPEELESRKLINYMLSPRGELFAQGVNHKMNSNFNYLFSFIDYDAWLGLLEWQKNLIERYKLHFSILGIRMKNVETLMESQGILNTEKIFIELFSKIKQLLRKTDISTKVNENILFLLPMTNAEGTMVLIKKIQNFINEQEATLKMTTIGVELSFITSEELISLGIHSDLLLTELTARMEN